MPIQPQYNVASLHADSPEMSDVGKLGAWITKYITRRLSQIFQGPTDQAWGSLGTAFTVKLNDFSLQTGILSANTTITLDLTHTRAGCFGFVELTQDGTGGRVVGWTNASWSGGAAPVIAAGAGKKTMLLFVHNGTSWVGSVLATNY